MTNGKKEAWLRKDKSSCEASLRVTLRGSIIDGDGGKVFRRVPAEDGTDDPTLKYCELSI